MARKPYKKYKGIFTDGNGNPVRMQIIEYESRVFILVDEGDMTLQGNFNDLAVGMTDGPPDVIRLQDGDNDEFDLDVTNPGVPILTKVKK
jgi:hypothetical protein